MISPVKVWRRQKELREVLGRKGKILTWTKIHVSGSDFKSFAPYPVVLVEFRIPSKQKDPKIKRAFGQLVDWSEGDLKIGRQVVSVLRKVRKASKEGVIAYGIKFKPTN